MLRRVLVAVLGALLAGGCTTPGHRPPGHADTTLAAVLGAHNARAASLDRLWARASVEVTGRTDGGRLREQAEGHLQIVRPGRVALSLGKLGKVQLYLGANEELYWWIDMLDPDGASVVFGRHARITPEKAEMLGVPVSPRDLVRLLGITPIDAADVEGGLRKIGRRPAVDVRLDGGLMRVFFARPNFEPARVEMYSADGRLLVASDLERYGYVTVVGDATAKPRVAEKVTLTLDGGTVVRLSLYDPTNKPIRDSAFDLDLLVRGYRIERAFDLDDQNGGGS